MKNVLRVFLLLAAGLSWAGGSYAQSADGALGKLAPKTREVLETRCALCHGIEGESAGAIYPRLVGQYPSWLVTQLEDFARRERTHDNARWHGSASKLAGLEMHAVAAYLAGQQ